MCDFKECTVCSTPLEVTGVRIDTHLVEPYEGAMLVGNMVPYHQKKVTDVKGGKRITRSILNDDQSFVCDKCIEKLEGKGSWQYLGSLFLRRKHQLGDLNRVESEIKSFGVDIGEAING